MAAASFLQVVCQETHRPLPGVGSIGSAIAVFVVGIFEGVSRIRINLDFHFLAQLLKGSLKFVNVLRRNASILSAENSQDRRMDLLERVGVDGEMPVVDHGG